MTDAAQFKFELQPKGAKFLRTADAGTTANGNFEPDVFYLFPVQPLSNVTWEDLYAKLQRKARANQSMVPAVPYMPPSR